MSLQTSIETMATHLSLLAFARSNTDSSNQSMALARATTDAKTTTTVEVICATAEGSLVDTTEFNLVVYR